MKAQIRQIIWALLGASVIAMAFQNCARSVDISQYSSGTASQASTSPSPSPGQGSGLTTSPSPGPNPAPTPAPAPAPAPSPVAKPTITTAPPATVTITAGMPIDLTVGVTGATSYQWYLNGAAIADTTASYSVASSVVADSGTYTLDAANSGGVVTASTVVTVNAAPVYAAPTITTPPSSVASEYLTAGTGYDFYVEPIAQTAPYNTVKFSVVAAGQDLTYQWYFGTTAIAGATSATYSFALTAMSQIGTYKVVVSNPANQPVSAAATLTTAPLDISF